jgi:hypothetical protein
VSTSTGIREVAQRPPVTDLSAPSHVEQRLAISGARS